MKSSEVIKSFLDLIDESRKKYSAAFEKVGEQDKLTQDLLHKLELGAYKDRNKIATQLARCRKDRRGYKDIREEAEVIIAWTTTREGEKVLKELKKTLGELRKVEQYHENRAYKPRVLKK